MLGRIYVVEFVDVTNAIHPLAVPICSSTTTSVMVAFGLGVVVMVLVAVRVVVWRFMTPAKYPKYPAEPIKIMAITIAIERAWLMALELFNSFTLFPYSYAQWELLPFITVDEDTLPDGTCSVTQSVPMGGIAPAKFSFSPL